MHILPTWAGVRSIVNLPSLSRMGAWYLWLLAEVASKTTSQQSSFASMYWIPSEDTGTPNSFALKIPLESSLLPMKAAHFKCGDCSTFMRRSVPIFPLPIIATFNG